MTSDYISREAADEACWKAVRRYPNSFCIPIEAARAAIRKLPAADVRPVVYCRECIHWKKSELVICGNDDMVCDYHLGARYCRHADDFCSKGERRADE